MKTKIFLIFTVSIIASTLWLSGCQSSSQSSASQTSQQPSSSQQQSQTSSSTENSSKNTTQESSSASTTASNEQQHSQEQNAAGASNADAVDDFALSSDEKIEALDQQLDDSFTEFDTMILEQQASATALGVPFDDQSGDTTEADESFEDEDLFEEGDLYEGLPGYGDNSEDGRNTNGSDEAADGSDTQRQGTQTAGSSSGTVPADIPSGSDDDIVARQIREAASKEQDPVLREKLWDEYRKYKNQ